MKFNLLHPSRTALLSRMNEPGKQISNTICARAGASELCTFLVRKRHSAAAAAGFAEMLNRKRARFANSIYRARLVHGGNCTGRKRRNHGRRHSKQRVSNFFSRSLERFIWLRKKNIQKYDPTGFSRCTICAVHSRSGIHLVWKYTFVVASIGIAFCIVFGIVCWCIVYV